MGLHSITTGTTSLLETGLVNSVTHTCLYLLRTLNITKKNDTLHCKKHEWAQQILDSEAEHKRLGVIILIYQYIQSTLLLVVMHLDYNRTE